MPKYTDFALPVKIAGVKFRNPFYVSSGPTTMNIEQLEKIRDCGWGAASLKLTVFPLPYINRKPRYGYYPDRNFLTFTAEKRLLLDELLKLIEEGKKRTPEIVLFANITYAGEDGPAGWVKMAKACEAAGVDIVELNMCCPNMSFNVEVSGIDTGGPKTGASMGKQKKIATDIVSAVKKSLKIPLFVKLTPEGGQIAEIAKSLFEVGADAVGGTANRLGVPPINLDEPARSSYYLQKEIGMACMNGPWLKPLALRDVYEIRKAVGSAKVLTAPGGVTTWEDAVEMAMCGADLVGICAATIIHGFGFMPEFIHGVKKYMKEKGYKDFRAMRDILIPVITSAPKLTIYDGNARLKAERPVAPCISACPNSVPAQGYIRRVAEEEFESAYRLIMSKSPLQSICGEICDHPCESECTRGLKDEPVMIRAIKRFVLNMAEKEGWKPEILCKKDKSQAAKVAVIGAGPAGLSSAYDLARAGYEVTVFEAAKKAGGMLRYGVPAFRLKEKTLDKEIKVIKDLGVKILTDRVFGKDVTFASLKKEGFKAFFLGVGAGHGVRAGIPDEDAKGCFSAIDFLKAVAEDKAPVIGKTVAVIGGGFTAIDSARTAKRLGAKEVFVLYRRTKDEMPATQEEVSEAEEEGVKIMYLVAAKNVNVEKGRVKSVWLLNYVLGPKDPASRRKPLEVPGTEFKLEVDSLIFAVGQQTVFEELKLSKKGVIEVDEKTCRTFLEGVYAGGDCVLGPKDVISAVALGKRAAVSIDKYLSGKDAFLKYSPATKPADKEAALMRHGGEPRVMRQKEKKTAAEKRAQNFTGYTEVLTKEEAVKEAERCMACGCGAGCQICHDICKMFAYSINESGRMELDEDKCVGCGMCLHRCPNEALEMIQLQG